MAACKCKKLCKNKRKTCCKKKTYSGTRRR